MEEERSQALGGCWYLSSGRLVTASVHLLHLKKSIVKLIAHIPVGALYLH